MPVRVKHIVSIIGEGIVGKRFMIYQTTKKLIKSVPRENILYINFKDERLRNLDETLFI